MEQISFGRRLLNAILTVLFSLAVFVVITIGVMNNTLFSPDFYIRQIDESDFSEIVLDEVHEAFNSYTGELRLPDDFVTDRITFEQVDEAIKQTVIAEFSNTAQYDYSVLTDQLVDDIQKYVEDYVEQETGFPFDATDMMAGFDDKLDEVFAQYFETSAFSRVAKFVRTYGPIVGIGQWIFAAIALIILALILRLSPNRTARLRNMMFSFCALVLLNGLGFLAKFLPVDIFLRFLNMNLARESVRVLVIQCIDSAFSAFLWPLMVSSALMLIFVIIYCLNRRTTKQRALIKEENSLKRPKCVNEKSWQRTEQATGAGLFSERRRNEAIKKNRR